MVPAPLSRRKGRRGTQGGLRAMPDYDANALTMLLIQLGAKPLGRTLLERIGIVDLCLRVGPIGPCLQRGRPRVDKAGVIKADSPSTPANVQ